MTRPRVGVVIATHNRRTSLERTLAHLRALPERADIVVVDNCSSDGTPELARRAGARVIELAREAGPAARTLGVRALACETVAFADDDSWWAPGALGRAAELFATRPRLGLLAARILVGPEERLDPVCRLMADSPLPTAPGLPGRSVLGFVACGTVVRRSAYLAVGGFATRFGFGGEEQLLALDLAACGWELAYAEELVAHHWPSRGAANRDRRPATELRNGLWTAWLRRRPSAALAITTRSALAAAREGRAQAITGAIAELPWALRHRRPLPPELERQVVRLG